MNWLHRWRDAGLRQRLAIYGRRGAWSTLEYLAYPLLMLACTPLFLRSLGTHQYGQWMLLVTLGNLGGLAGLGMGAATIKDVSAARGRGDMGFAVQAVRVASFIAMACSVVVVAALLAAWALGGHALLARMGSEDDLLPLIVGALCLVGLEQLDSVYAGALRGLERFDTSARVEVSAKFAIVLGSLAVALVWGRLDLIVALTLVLTALRAAAKGWLAARLLGQGPLWPVWNRSMARHVLQFGKWSWLQSLGSALFSVADRLVIGSVLGADALARYSLCLQLAQQVHTLPAAATSFLFPMFSRKLEAGIDMRRWVLGLVVGLALVAGLIALPLWLLAEPILRLWVGADVATASAGLLALLALSHWVLSFTITPHYFLYGANAARFVAAANIAAGLASTAVNLVFIPAYGLAAAALSRLVYGAVAAALYAWRLRRRPA